jgi:acetyl-CoA C-acetyltransferase/acetyl-CoA acyltransferase
MDVAVVGVGETRFGVLEEDLKGLFHEAFSRAIADVVKGIDPKEIDEAWIGSLKTGGSQLGNLAPLLMEQVGLAGVPACSVENACSSGAYAFRYAYMAIKSGVCDVALAAGVEKMTDLTRERNRYWLGVSGDVEWERSAGVTFPGIYAMMALRYMHEHGLKRERLAEVAVKNHKNGARNPDAQLQYEISLEKAMGAPMVAYPLTVYDACPITDGAAVAILCRGDLASRYTDTPVYVMGSGASSDHLAIHDRRDMTTVAAAQKAADDAYRQAGIKPKDVDLAELHDCFTIAEIMAYENCGFAEKGRGGELIKNGQTDIGGKIPVNAGGGLKAKGHPIGATGVGQIYEVVKQLRGEAREKSRQIPDAEIGLTHSVGGSGGSACVHILRR